jgi:putative oxidoreductase
MDLIQRSEAWRAEHFESKFLGIIRFILGITLLGIGIYFIQNTGPVTSMLSAHTNWQFGAITLAHFIALFHLCGGFMLALGFLTRVSIIFQLPFVLGAVLFANAERGVFTVYSGFWLSVVCALLMIFFLYYGPGKYSLDTYLSKKRFYE